MGQCRLAIVSLCALALACDPQAGAGSDDEGDEQNEESFSEPILVFGDARLAFTADRRDDINLRATNIERGRTFARIDGVPLIQAGIDGPEGSLQEGLLVVSLAGNLAAGEHTLDLITMGDTKLFASDPIRIEVEGVPAMELPTMKADDARADLGPTTHLIGRGQVGGTVLSLLSLADPEAPAIAIVARGQTRWLSGTPTHGELSSLRIDDLADAGVSAITDLIDVQPRTSGNNGLSYRVAWRQELAGDRVVESAISANAQSAPVPIFDVDMVADPNAQAGRVDAVRYVGDRIAVAYTARLDADAPRPGDAALGVLERTAIDEVQLRGRLLVDGRNDIDALDAVFDDGATDGRSGRLGIRTHGSSPRVVYESDTVPGLEAASDPALASSDAFAGTWAGRLGFLGALTSTTYVGVKLDGTVRVVNAIGATGESEVVDLPPLTPSDVPVTGPPSGASMRGLAVVAVPFGDLADVRVVVVSGLEFRVSTLAGIRCDEVVLDASPRAVDEAVSDLACLHAGATTLHEVFLPS